MNSSLVKSSMKPSRKRKRSSIAHDMSKNETTPKRARTEISFKAKKRKVQLTSESSSALVANVRDIKIILDRSIVDKYFRAKQMLREILSPTNPQNLRPKSDQQSKEGKKQTSLLDYLQVNNDSLTSLSSKDSVICQNVSIKKEPQDLTADIDQINTAMLDVNTPRIMYYASNDQSNCFFYNNNLVVMPTDAQFTPEDFVFNNCGFVSIMGVPIKTEVPEESIDIEELDETNVIRENTMSDVMSISEIATTSTPMIKTSTLDEQKIKPETKQLTAKSAKQGILACSKCDRRFRMSELFEQHKFFCGLEFLYGCTYCAYNTKYCHSVRMHVQRKHKKEVEEEGLEEIMKKIRNRRNDNKKVEQDSEAEEGVMIKNIEFKHSKPKFDLFCSQCQKSFKKVRYQRVKLCPDCEIILKCKCLKCEKIFSDPNIYRHIIICGNETLKVRKNVSYDCAHCTFKVSYKMELRKHIFQRHMKNDKSMYYKCKNCSFESLYENNFKRHRQNVHGINETIDFDD